MYQACIFDLDGTLTDTLDSITRSVNETLQRLDLGGITKKECRAFVGSGARVLIEQALTATAESDAQADRAMDIYRDIFQEYCTWHVTPYDGIRELLAELKKKNFYLAVLSNKPHEQAKKVVREVFGQELFDVVQGQTDAIPRKPDPTAARKIAEGFGVQSDACIYIGDSDVDMQTGLAAGMKTVGVTWGYRSREILLLNGADTLIDHPQELLKIAEEKE